MPSFQQTYAGWRSEHPNQHPAIGLAALILAASIWVGLRSRAVAGELAGKRQTWQGTADQLATVRQQFRVPSSSESAALLAESARLGALGVPPSERVSLMELVARLADASGLADVQVNFRSAPDSAFVPPRSIGSSSLSPAPYTIAVDFTGSFQGVVQFVSNLPPSVSVSRVSAGRRPDRPAYHILLAVYELPDGDNAS